MEGTMTTLDPLSVGCSDGDVAYQAIQGYLPMHDGEIELTAGDVITNVKDLQNGWTLGRNVSRDSVGIFPTDFVVPNLDIITPPEEREFIINKESPSKPESNSFLAEIQAAAKKRAARTKQEDNNKHNNNKNQVPPHTYEKLKAATNGGIIPSPKHPQKHLDDTTDFPDGDEFMSNSLPSPRKGKLGNNNRKPQMFVRPNPSKNIFNKQDTQVKLPDCESEPQHGSPQDARRSTSSTPPSTRGTPPQPREARVRISAPPGQISSMIAAEVLRPADPRLPPQEVAIPKASTSGVTRVASEEDLNTPTESSSPIATGMEATEHQNMTNENIHQNSPRVSQKHLYTAEAKRQYYQDYRTLECPPNGEGPPMGLKYKPILKKGGHHSPYNRANEIYYREEHDQQRSMRLLLSVLAGIFIGCVLFLWLHFALAYSFMTTLIMCATISLLLIVAFGISCLCRCIGALLVPSLCTTRGRIAFLVIITGFLLDGPITNIYVNMGEVSRSMSCSAEQSYNQSMLLLQPFDSMMIQLNRTVSHLQQAAYNISTGLKPLDHGLNHAEVALYDGHVAMTATEKICRTMIDRAFNECSHGIIEAQNECLGVVTALGDVYHIARDVLDRLNPEHWAPAHVSLKKRQVLTADSTLSSIPEHKRDVCEPLDMIMVCQSLNDSDVLCQPAGWAGEAIYDAINATNSAMAKLKRTLQFSINPEPYYNTRINASRTLYQVRKHVHAEFHKRTAHFHSVISVLKKILPIAILLLIYVAYSHIRNYVSKDTYDNVYVTPQFKSLDQKRSEVAGESLLPLKKYERNYLIDTTLSELSPPEDGLYRIGMCVLSLHLLIAFICYFFDYILYWILALIRKHGDPRYDFTGKDSLEYVITGEGVISDLLHVFLKGFHPANLFGYTLDTHYCLPKPSPPSIVILLVIFLLYFGLILTILLKAYILRFRNRITAYFFPDRQKARIVHLYNVVLNHRYKMPKLLQQRAKSNYRERCMREQISVLHRAAVKIPPCRVFVYKQAKCLVCLCLEDQTFRDCQTDRCQGVFCAECYDDLGRICPLCHQASEYSDEEDYEELEDDLQPYYRSSKIYV